ncbi:FIST signal transduction protein [Desulfonatronum parangueonense]
MQVHFLQDPDSESLGRLIRQVSEQDQIRSLLILACDADDLKAEQLDPFLRDVPLPLFGGIFPQILHGSRKLERGALVVGLRAPVVSGVITGLSDPNADFTAQIQNLFGDRHLTDKTMFVFVDGLSTRITDLVDALFNNLGLLPNYIGGGAGSLSFRQSPCLFTNQGLLQDAVVLALADSTSSIGVAHGWTPISEAFKVTQSERNTVISLNWRPAFEVYREVVEAHSGRSFAEESFFDLAKSYPLGIAKLDAEMIVRDPIILDETRIVCVGEVAEGSHAHILSGNIDSLVAGAARARDLAEEGLPPPPGRMDSCCLSIAFPASFSWSTILTRNWPRWSGRCRLSAP